MAADSDRIKTHLRRLNTLAEMAATLEYRQLFQSERCEWDGCKQFADGYLTAFCRNHEQEWFAAPQSERT